MSFVELANNVKESLRTCGGLFELTERRNVLSSALSGVLFMLGWWCIIDVAVIHPSETEFHHAYHVCGVMSTLAFVMINAVSNGQIRGEGYADGCVGQRGARIWLFLGFLLGFSAVIAATWILFQAYVVGSGQSTTAPTKWPGIGLFLQNVLIFISALVFKFGRTDEAM